MRNPVCFYLILRLLSVCCVLDPVLYVTGIIKRTDVDNGGSRAIYKLFSYI